MAGVRGRVGSPRGLSRAPAVAHTGKTVPAPDRTASTRRGGGALAAQGKCAKLELRDVATKFYRHEFALEDVLAGSFPARPADADAVRRMVAEDIGADRLGIAARRDDGGAVHIAYPVAVVSGRKPLEQ